MSAFAVTGDHGPNLFRLAIEFTILSVAAVVAAALAWFVPPIREWLAQTLAFGWVPAGLYATIALLVLVHRPLNLFTGWRWWLAGALFVALLIGAAGFVRGESGALYAYGMSGAWGHALTGGNLGVAIVEFVVAGALIGVLVIPHSVRWYWAAARFSAIGLWAVLAATATVVRITQRVDALGYRRSDPGCRNHDRQPPGKRRNSQTESAKETQKAQTGSGTAGSLSHRIARLRVQGRLAVASHRHPGSVGSPPG